MRVQRNREYLQNNNHLTISHCCHWAQRTTFTTNAGPAANWKWQHWSSIINLKAGTLNSVEFFIKCNYFICLSFPLGKLLFSRLNKAWKNNTFFSHPLVIVVAVKAEEEGWCHFLFWLFKSFSGLHAAQLFCDWGSHVIKKELWVAVSSGQVLWTGTALHGTGSRTETHAVFLQNFNLDIFYKASSILLCSVFTAWWRLLTNCVDVSHAELKAFHGFEFFFFKFAFVEALNPKQHCLSNVTF